MIDVPQVEWQKMENQKNPETGPSTSTPTRTEPPRFMSFWDLVGSECTEKTTPGNMLELEVSTEIISPHADIEGVKGRLFIEADLTADSPTDIHEISIVAGKRLERKSRQEEFLLAEKNKK